MCRIDISGTDSERNPDLDEDDTDDQPRQYGSSTSNFVGINTTGTQPKPGTGFSTFQKLKNFIGSAGENNHWHHIVEQCQIGKSGFSPEQIQNTSNVVSLDQATHAKITGYYNTTSFDFTEGLSVRNWLAGTPFSVQYGFGIYVLSQFGVLYE